MSATLKANWNYPTTVWAGPGRIAELPAACARLGIQRPLLVTDEGLRDARLSLALATQMVIRNGLHLVGVSAPDTM